MAALRYIAVFSAAVVLSAAALVSEDPKRAKSFYREGEDLLQKKDALKAFQQFRRAAELQPSNTKYRKKLAEVAKAASAEADRNARKLITANPCEARVWLRAALSYDAGSTSAAEVLAEIEQRVDSATKRTAEAQQALDNGEIETATGILSALRLYLECIPGLAALDRELAAAARAFSAQSLIDRQEIAQGLEEISIAEKEAPQSRFITNLSRRVRRAAADSFVDKAEGLSSGTAPALVEQLQLAKSGLAIDENNERAQKLESAAAKALIDGLSKRFEHVSSSLPAAQNDRLRLAILELAKPSRRSAAYEKSLAELKPYPALTARVVIADMKDCPSPLRGDSLEPLIGKAFSPAVGRVGEGQPSLSVTLKLTCAATDIPRQSVESINSTYVAGHNQLANPEYIRIQNALVDAEKEFERVKKSNAESSGGGFWGGLAAGMAEGAARNRVQKVRAALEATPPYITREILQNYQYQKFEAYRAYQAQGHVVLSAADGFAVEERVSFEASDRQEGFSGVLPQDKTGALNRQPTLLPVENLANRMSDGFYGALEKAIREMVAGYFASEGMDSTRSDGQRLVALLYLFDGAEGTRYQTHRERIAPVMTASLMSGPEGVSSALRSLSLPIPERLSRSNPPAQSSMDDAIEKAIAASVAIETDTGAQGSGFFMTTGCLALTNEHVVANAQVIVLRTSARRLLTAEILASDPGRDLALLRTNSKSCAPLTLGDSESAVVGQEVWTVGSPLGLAGTVTRGIISAFRTLNDVRLIQIDAAVNPGNSGGPVIGREGRVLGVTTFKARGYEGLNFAVGSAEISAAFGRYLR